MTQLLTLNNIRQQIGRLWLTSEYTVNSDLMQKYAMAVGDNNSRWQGCNAVVPPAMLATLGFRGALSALLGLSATVLHGSSDFSLYLPVRIGDSVIVATKIASLRERKHPAGSQAFITLQQDYTNDRGEKVACCKQLVVVRLGAANG